MNPVRIIEKKRDGKTLNPKEIQWMIQQYDEGSIPDYQMAALLMAIYYQGMNDEEIWTYDLRHGGIRRHH
jgi:pyrimidine-nucleoside phosphorylase